MNINQKKEEGKKLGENEKKKRRKK